MSDCQIPRYGDLEWLQSIEDDSESDIASRSTSSTLSWTDEAEREVSEEMKNQYNLFESVLYSELDGEDLPEALLNEVAIWKQHSPHLRISGTQITSTYDEIEEKYPEDYEEVFILHSDHDDIINHFQRQCNISDDISIESLKNPLNLDDRGELFDKAWLKNENGHSSIESRYSSLLKLSPKEENNKSFHILEETYQIIEPNESRIPLANRSCLTRHEDKCNHITQHKGQSDQQLKPPPSCKDRKLSPAKVPQRHPSSYSANRTAGRVSLTTSACLHKRKFMAPEFSQNVSQKTDDTDAQPLKHNLLPPIQGTPITPKLPNKRANSAMMRFSKTLPRTRPNTSRNKAIFLTPIDDSDNSDRYSERTRDISPRGDGHLSPLGPPLPFCSRSKQNVLKQVPRRWRY